MIQIEVENRENGLSIQGAFIKNNIEGAKELLKKALDALEKKPDFEYQHEVVFNHEKKT